MDYPGGRVALDTMTPNSRKFYETTLDKTLWSLFACVLALVGLGFCTTYGGLAAQYDYESDSYDDGIDDLAVMQTNNIKAAYGFSSFLFFVSFLLYIFAAIYISPLVCGSDNEKSILMKPDELPSTQAV